MIYAKWVMLWLQLCMYGHIATEFKDGLVRLPFSWLMMVLKNCKKSGNKKISCSLNCVNTSTKAGNSCIHVVSSH